MAKRIEPCPICGGDDFATGAPLVATCERRMRIIRCRNCGMQFIPDAGDWDEAIDKMNRRVEK